jgi:adenylate cyclase
MTTKTIAFVDLCGFTSYTEAHGDGAAAAVVRAFRRLVRAEASRSGIELIRWTGDGAMLIGDRRDATRACAEALVRGTSEQGPLALRGGVAEGPIVALDDDDYVGAAVNRAARLCRDAEPHRVDVEDRRVARPAATTTRDRVIASLMRCPADARAG